MNSFWTAKKGSRIAAGFLTLLLYAAVLCLLMRGFSPDWRRTLESPAAVILSFAQMELQSDPAPAPPEIPDEEREEKPAEETVPPPESLSRMEEEEAVPAVKEQEDRPSPEEHADLPDEPPVPEQSEEQEAKIDQAAASEISLVEPDALRIWVMQIIEREKYYPPAARNAGYEGKFSLLIKIGPDGIIESADITGGEGHILLRNALLRILDGLPGRRFEPPPMKAVELPFEFEFKME